MPSETPKIGEKRERGEEVNSSKSNSTPVEKKKQDATSPTRNRLSKPPKKRYKPMRSITSFFRKPIDKSKSDKQKDAGETIKKKTGKNSKDSVGIKTQKDTENAPSVHSDNREEKKTSLKSNLGRSESSGSSEEENRPTEDQKEEKGVIPAFKHFAIAKPKLEDSKRFYESASEKANKDEAIGMEVDEVVDSDAETEASEDEPKEKSSLNFHPLKSAKWKKGGKIPYASLVKLFQDVEENPKRLTKTRLVANYFRSVLATNPEKLVKVFYLCCNKIAPQYEGLELGIGNGILLKALSEATGTGMQKLKKLLGEIGDLGDIAQKRRSKQRTMFPLPPLTVSGIFTNFIKLAKTAGKNSGKFKKDLIKKMLVACKDLEAKYLTRALQGNLRIGLAAQTVIAALAQAVVYTPPNSKVLDASEKMSTEKLEEKLKTTEQIVKQAFIEVPNFDYVISMLLKHGVSDLNKHCQLTPGIPIKVMLGKPATSVSELFDKFIDVLLTIEFKYDGERAQIHLLPDGSIKIFSRNSEDNTGKYPDLVATLPECHSKEVKSFIIDCEVVAWDSNEKKILPFQTLSQRKRKGVANSNIEINVVLFAFDCLFLNGKSLIKEQFVDRRQALRDNFHEVDGKFFFAKGIDVKGESEVKDFLKLSIDSSCEGLMVKALDKDAQYVPDKRNWLKLKKDYLDGCGDSLDLVPIGAFRGQGKRAGVYGCFLLACYDPDTEEYQSITKIGTGFSEEDLRQHTAFFKDKLIEAPKSYYRYEKSMECDVWFEPCQVWEVKAADLSISPAHKAAMGKVHPSKGIALRFPRFLRIRPDKSAENSTSADEVVDMYHAQSVRS
mmetsp:Transcript_4412/g.6601  ORF Transcript_4412/g.6601 Transcript_4412/m.6601 type:complete len:836 (-) Transcript_4412:86-2593(-)